MNHTDHTSTVKPLGTLRRYLDLGWHLVTTHGVIPGWPELDGQSCSCPSELSCPQAGKHPWKQWKDRRKPMNWSQTRGAFFDYRQRHRGCDPNWAVVLGRSGLCALDVDAHAGGPDGRSAFEAMVAEHGPLPRTPRDSRGHYLFRLPAEAAGWATKIDLAPGVELLTGNESADHLLYVPPSNHRDGTSYEWVVAPWECEPAELPAWVLESARAKSAERLATQTSAETSGPSTVRVELAKRAKVDVYERARRYVAAMGGAVGGKGGHDHTFKVACRLVVGFGLCANEALPILKEWNLSCSPPWADRELLHKLDDAEKAPGRRGDLLDGDGADAIPFELVRPGKKGERRAKNPCPGYDAPAGRDTPPPLAPTATADDLSAAFPRNPGPCRAARAAEAEAAELREENRVANEIYQLRARQYACPKNNRPILENRWNYSIVVANVRCDQWSCPACALLHKEEWKANVRLRLGTAERSGRDTAYALEIPARDWSTTRKRIARARGQYFRFKLGDGSYLVVTTAPVEGATPAPLAAARDRLESLINSHYGDKRPVTSSRPWQIPKPGRKPSQYRRVGQVNKKLTDGEIDRMAAAAHCEVRESPTPPEHRHRIRRWRKLLCPHGWGQTQRDHLYWCLTLGEWPAGDSREEGWGEFNCEIVPPKRRGPRPEVIDAEEAEWLENLNLAVIETDPGEW